MASIPPEVYLRGALPIIMTCANCKAKCRHLMILKYLKCDNCGRKTDPKSLKLPDLYGCISD